MVDCMFEQIQCHYEPLHLAKLGISGYNVYPKLHPSMKIKIDIMD